MKIPKNIYQIFIGGNLALPEKVIKNIEFIKKQNPSYTHTLFRDNDVETFIKKEYNEFILDLYLSINEDYAASRADFFRYLLINKVGGIYLDIKSAPRKPLDLIIDEEDEYLISYWNSPKGCSFHGPKGEIQMFWIISIKNNPFLDKVIKNVITNILFYNKNDVGYRGVWKVTGPIVYTDTVKKYLPLYNYRIVKEFIEKNKFRYKKIFNKPHYTELNTPIISNMWI